MDLFEKIEDELEKMSEKMERAEMMDDERREMYYQGYILGVMFVRDLLKDPKYKYDLKK